MQIKEDLLTTYHAAINAVAGKQVVSREMQHKKYSDKRYHVIAIGKAADAMVLGLPDKNIIDGLVISKHGHFSDQLLQDSRFNCIESDHPIPNESSILAGEELLKYLKKIPPDANCLFLISGGASALVEVLQDNWSLKDLSQLSNYLLANAFPINEINAIRKKTSKIKGGGLWNYIKSKSVDCLIISDVPNDEPMDIGSGLLFPSTSSNNILTTKIPEKWAARIQTQAHIKIGETFNWKIIASLSNAKQAAAKQAKQLGYQVEIINSFLDGKAIDVAKSCIDRVKNKPQTLFIWGGETTVILPDSANNAGKGGRNQHLALAAAIYMKDHIKSSNNCYLLAAGTDGSDGVSTATGALVDNHTVEKGKKLKLNAEKYLQQTNSNTFFMETKEAIITGATGTNVMDLVFGILINS